MVRSETEKQPTDAFAFPAAAQAQATPSTDDCTVIILCRGHMELTVAWLFTAFLGSSMIIPGRDMSWIYFLILITFLLSRFWVYNMASAANSSTL